MFQQQVACELGYSKKKVVEALQQAKYKCAGDLVVYLFDNDTYSDSSNDDDDEEVMCCSSNNDTKDNHKLIEHCYEISFCALN